MNLKFFLSKYYYNNLYYTKNSNSAWSVLFKKLKESAGSNVKLCNLPKIKAVLNHFGLQIVKTNEFPVAKLSIRTIMNFVNNLPYCIEKSCLICNIIFGTQYSPF